MSHAIVEEVLGGSRFGALPAATRAELARGARIIEQEAGAVRHREGDDRLHLDIVATGLARAYVTDQNGRSMTIRYCRPGDLLGAVSLYARPFYMPATVQSLVATVFVALDPYVLRSLADTDARVAAILLDELAERVSHFIAEIPGSAFATIRQRVARHILDLAAERQTGTELVAAVSQQGLADAVGTAREVVVRVLGELRRDGIVSTERGSIVILVPARLLAETYEPEAAAAEAKWNPGS